MSKPNREELHQLGLDVDPDELEVESLRPIDDEIARGYAAQPADPPLELPDLVALAAGAASPDFRGATKLVTEGVAVYSFPRQPGAYLVETDADAIASFGAVAKIPGVDGSWIALARTARAGIWTGATRLLFDAVSVERLRVRAWRGFGGAPEVPAPPIADWLAITPFPPWLAEACTREAASESRLRRAVAAANVARLWFVPDAPGEAAVVRWVTERPPTPADAARGWFAALPPMTLAAIEGWGIDRAHALVAEFPPSSRSAALAWLHARDDLASLAEALQRTGLPSVLAVVDAQVAGDLCWTSLAPFDDPRLFAVGTQDPTAWWSALAAY